LLALTASARAASPVVESVAASSEAPGFVATNALDGDATTAWCATSGDEQWWEARFARSVKIGAIRQRSGEYAGNRQSGGKLRDFEWRYRRAGETAWRSIPGTATRTQRAQVILRFPALERVEALRLVVHAAAEPACLREVAFFPEENAEISVPPWYLAVATFSDADPLHPLVHDGSPVFWVHDAVHLALHELGSADTPDGVDEAWIGDDFRDAALREPRPAGILLSGNYKDYDTIDPRAYESFYRYLRESPGAVPLLGACGGHQLLAMSVANESWQGFAREFGVGAPRSLEQVDVTCSEDPAYACGSEPASSCCYEGGWPDPIRRVAANVPGRAMENPFRTPRADFLFNLLPPGFDAYLFHSDYVNAARVAPWFDVIASYPSDVARLDRAHPSLVQAIKLHDAPVYGTQFHWDENQAGACDRTEANRNMERVLKNFVLLSLRRPFEARGPGNLSALSDLDRDSLWCAPGSDATLELRFGSRATLSAVAAIVGETPADAARTTLSYETSNDGVFWKKLRATRESLHELQAAGDCGELPGLEDGQSFLSRLEPAPRARRLRVHVHSEGGRACLRELLPLSIPRETSP
jgi:GMP synthase-like glutamine amidotransferase